MEKLMTAKLSITTAQGTGVIPAGQPHQAKPGVMSAALRRTVMAGLAVLGVTCVHSALAVQPPDVTDVVGVWNNINPKTKGILKIVVTADSGGALTVHGYGACSPNPCDWGTTSAKAFSSNVSSQTAEGWNALFEFNYATDQLAAVVLPHFKAQKYNYLKVISQTTFNADDSRYDDQATYFFVKAPSTSGAITSQ
jgi:hypothetical protein